MTRAVVRLFALAACALACPALVHAEGETLMPGGASGVGRGGAVGANPSDALTLMHNPAGLTALGGHAGYYGVDMAIDNMCAHPYGYYGWGVVLPENRPGSPPNIDVRRSEFGDPASAAYGARQLDYVCNSGSMLPLPQLAVALRLMDKLMIGVGLVAPVLITGSQWGGKDGTIRSGSRSARPTPARYALVRQEVEFAFNPTIGAAYQALPWLSFGFAFQMAMASVNNYQVMALRAGTSPSTDLMAKVHASDYFMPSLSFGVYAAPIKRLRIGATFTWAEGLDGSGDLTFTTNYYHRGAIDDEFVPLENDPVRLQRVRVPAPWAVTLALRYVEPAETEADKHDPMRNQVWDVELDASYASTGHVAQTVAEVANDFTLDFRRANGEAQEPLEVKKRDLSQLAIDRKGQDTLALRLGGSWNILPGFLQASLGGFVQSRSVQVSYMSIDNYGAARLGFGVGAMMRLGPIELMASYAHVFQETIDLAPPQHQPREQASDDPTTGFDQRIYGEGRLGAEPLADARAPSPANADGVAKVRQTAVFESKSVRARVVNAGRYTASFNVFSIALAHRF